MAWVHALVGNYCRKTPHCKPSQCAAFDNMGATLLKPLSLHLLDRNTGFMLRTDASENVVKAVLELVQGYGSHVPVAFSSRILAARQLQMWTPREKEAYTTVCALRKWAGQIALQPVTVCTDHQ